MATTVFTRLQTGAGGRRVADQFRDEEFAVAFIDPDADAAIALALSPFVAGALGAGVARIGVQVGHDGVEDGLIDVFGRCLTKRCRGQAGAFDRLRRDGGPAARIVGRRCRSSPIGLPLLVSRRYWAAGPPKCLVHPGQPAQTIGRESAPCRPGSDRSPRSCHIRRRRPARPLGDPAAGPPAKSGPPCIPRSAGRSAAGRICPPRPQLFIRSAHCAPITAPLIGGNKAKVSTGVTGTQVTICTGRRMHVLFQQQHAGDDNMSHHEDREIGRRIVAR